MRFRVKPGMTSQGGVVYLGNVRVVADEQGTDRQVTHYYPFGSAFMDGKSPGLQPYKYNGKEQDKMHGLNLYDYHARHYDPPLGRFTTIDPLAEKYYNISPYVYVANNPMRFIDPDGKRIVFIIGKKHYSYTPQIGLVNINTGKQAYSLLNSKEYQLVNAYNEVYQSGSSELKNQIETLIASDNIHYIDLNKRGSNSVRAGNEYTTISEDKKKVSKGESIGTTTYYDLSEEKKKIFKTSTGVESSNTTLVAHELRHQYDYEKGNMKDRNGKGAKDAAEIRAVINENIMRDIEKLPKRTKYGQLEIDLDKLKK